MQRTEIIACDGVPQEAQDNMEKLKPLGEVLNPDARMDSFPLLALDRHHAVVASISLDRVVPDEVRSYFASVQNVVLYGWLSYDLFAIGNFLALTAVELALRHRFPATGEDRRPMYELLRIAIAQNALPSFPENRLTALRKVRNKFAHPQIRGIHTPGMAIATLRISAELINELFCSASVAPPNSP